MPCILSSASREGAQTSQCERFRISWSARDKKLYSQYTGKRAGRVPLKWREASVRRKRAAMWKQRER